MCRRSTQSVVLVSLAVLLVVAGLRLFGGLVRIALLIVLLLIAVDIVVPLVQH